MLVVSLDPNQGEELDKLAALNKTIAKISFSQLWSLY